MMDIKNILVQSPQDPILLEPALTLRIPADGLQEHHLHQRCRGATGDWSRTAGTKTGA
jgi:hypothetical protein